MFKMNTNTPPSSPVSMQCPGAPRKLPVIIEELDPHDICIILEDYYYLSKMYDEEISSSIGSNCIDTNELSFNDEEVSYVGSNCINTNDEEVSSPDKNSTNGIIIESEDNDEEVSSHCKLT